MLNDYGKIIGVLTGGMGTCDFPLLEVPGFGKFNNAWNGSNSIRDALHPNRSLIMPETEIEGRNLNCYSSDPLVLNGNYFPAKEYQPDNHIDIRSIGRILFASGETNDHNRGNFRLYEGSDFNFECSSFEIGEGIFEIDENAVFDPQMGKTCNQNAKIGINEKYEVQFDKEFIVNDELNLDMIYDIKVSPNPLSSYGKLSFYLPEKEIVNVEILNISGKSVIASIYNTIFNEGTHNITFDCSNLLSGVYICRFSTTSYTKSLKLTVIK